MAYGKADSFYFLSDEESLRFIRMMASELLKTAIRRDFVAVVPCLESVVRHATTLKKIGKPSKRAPLVPSQS
jgi:hypothetical protein